jgi:hypothetical protein
VKHRKNTRVASTKMVARGREQMIRLVWRGTVKTLQTRVSISKFNVMA